MKRLLLGEVWRQESGVAVIEFAVIAPILLIILFGLYNFTQLVMTKARLGSATADVARIFAYQKLRDPSDLQPISAMLEAQISSLIAEENFNQTINLAVACINKGTTVQLIGSSPLTLPPSFGSSGPPVIVARLSTDFAVLPSGLGVLIGLNDRMTISETVTLPQLFAPVETIQPPC